MPLYQVMWSYKAIRIIEAATKREAIQIAEQFDDDAWELLDDIPITARRVKTDAALVRAKGGSNG